MEGLQRIINEDIAPEGLQYFTQDYGTPAGHLGRQERPSLGGLSTDASPPPLITVFHRMSFGMVADDRSVVFSPSALWLPAAIIA